MRYRDDPVLVLQRCHDDSLLERIAGPVELQDRLPRPAAHGVRREGCDELQGRCDLDHRASDMGNDAHAIEAGEIRHAASLAEATDAAIVRLNDVDGTAFECFTPPSPPHLVCQVSPAATGMGWPARTAR